jgi:hypothetical protein
LVLEPLTYQSTVTPLTPYSSLIKKQQSASHIKMPAKEISSLGSIPVVVDLESNYQFGEDNEGESNLMELADQLPATTFWPFAREFFCKLPDLFLGGTGGRGHNGFDWKSSGGQHR